MKAHSQRVTPEMLKAWRQVFSSEKPGFKNPQTLAFGYPFVPTINEAMLFFPLDGYYLSKTRFDALIAGMVAVGDQAYFCSTYEDVEDFLFDGDVRGDPRHYELTTSEDYDTQCKAVPWPLEYAVYSGSGQWGLIVSHEMHGILGGSRQFIETVKAHYPLWRADIAAIKYRWAGNKNRGWLDSLLPRIRDAESIKAAPHPDDA